MSRIAIATLQTPWDCKWSRFGRMRSHAPGHRCRGFVGVRLRQRGETAH